MDLHLAGQPAVVFGGARGIGLAIAEAFAREGAPVAIVDRHPDTERVAADLAARANVAACGVVSDVTDYAAIRAAEATIADRLGGFVHLAYAVGAGSGKFGFPFWNLDPADWDRVWRINLLGAVHAAQAFCPRLVAQRRGTLLFLSSVAGQIGSQTDPPYSAAKAGLINFAQCAAKDLAGFDVRVNTICPGMVKTDLNRAVWQAWHDRQPPAERLSYEDWAQQKIERLTPLKRWQSPEDVAALAVFLASDQAHNITGQTMNVDGGWVMRG